jgi:hypothetical protein
VIPLMPEPMVTQDGTDHNDWARNAAKRFLAKLRQDHPHLKFIITEDRLRSNAPPAAWRGGRVASSGLHNPASACPTGLWHNSVCHFFVYAST